MSKGKSKSNITKANVTNITNVVTVSNKDGASEADKIVELLDTAVNKTVVRQVDASIKPRMYHRKVDGVMVIDYK